MYARNCAIAQTKANKLWWSTKAHTSVKTMSPTYKIEARILVFAHIFFSCLDGPTKNVVLQIALESSIPWLRYYPVKLHICPSVYITANFPACPAISPNSDAIEKNEITNPDHVCSGFHKKSAVLPNPVQTTQPMIRSFIVSVGKQLSFLYWEPPTVSMSATPTSIVSLELLLFKIYFDYNSWMG